MERTGVEHVIKEWDAAVDDARFIITMTQGQCYVGLLGYARDGASQRITAKMADVNFRYAGAAVSVAGTHAVIFW